MNRKQILKNKHILNQLQNLSRNDERYQSHLRYFDEKTYVAIENTIFALIFSISSIFIVAVYETYLKPKKDEKLVNQPLLCCNFARYYFIYICIIFGILLLSFIPIQFILGVTW